jgi:hypothetical protein
MASTNDRIEFDMIRTQRSVFGTSVAPIPGTAAESVRASSASPSNRSDATAAVDPAALGFPTTDSDEMALLYILRILNQASGPGPLSKVEQAFVVGARGMFEQLVKVCDELLRKVPPVYTTELAAASESPTSASAPADATEGDTKRTGRSRRRSDDTTT